MQNTPRKLQPKNVPDENSWVVFDVNKKTANVYSDRASKVVV